MNAPNHLISREESDSTILQSIASGDRFALENCIESYKNLVWKIARKYANNYEDAEDITQEIFIGIWMNAYRFDASKSPESAFICLLAHRKAIDVLRRRKIQFVEMDDNYPQKTVHQDIQIALDLRAIKQALRNLSPVENRLLTLSIFDGSSHAEIAELLRMPLGTVKSKIRRGIIKVRKSVGEPFLTDLHKAYYG